MVAVGFGMLTVAFPEAWTPAMLALPVLAGGLLMKLRGQLLLLVICIAVLVGGVLAPRARRRGLRRRRWPSSPPRRW